jgi:hypothetical protein
MTITPENVRCRVPAVVLLPYGQEGGFGASGFPYPAGLPSWGGTDGGYIIPRNGSITGFTICLDVAHDYDWKIWLNGSLLSGGPTENTASSTYVTAQYAIGRYKVSSGDRISVEYTGVGVSVPNRCSVLVEITYEP